VDHKIFTGIGVLMNVTVCFIMIESLNKMKYVQNSEFYNIYFEKRQFYPDII